MRGGNCEENPPLEPSRVHPAAVSRLRILCGPKPFPEQGEAGDEGQLCSSSSCPGYK